MTNISPERLTRNHWITLRDGKKAGNRSEWESINNFLKSEVGRTKRNRDSIRTKRKITIAPADPADPFNVAQREFVAALNNYLEFTHVTKGYQAALTLEATNDEGMEKFVAHSMKYIGLIALFVATSAAVLAAAAAAEYAAVGAAGGTFIGPAIAFVKAKWAALIAGFIAGIGISGSANWVVYLAKTRGISSGQIQSARLDEKRNYEAGGTYKEMRASESGVILAQNTRATRHARFWAFILGISASGAGYAAFNHSTGTEIMQQAGYPEAGSFANAGDKQILANAADSIRSFFGMLFGLRVAHANPSTTEASTQLLSSDSTKQGSLVSTETKVSGASADTQSGKGNSSTTDATKTRSGLPPKEITKLGEFPFAGSPEEAFSDDSIRKAAEWLTQKEGWSQAKKDAFIKYMTENRAEYIAAAKDPNYRGPLIDTLHGDERVMDAMVDKGGVRGPVRVPDGTRALVAEFPFTEADGTRKTAKVIVPVECFNFSDPVGADVVSPEASAAPRATTYALTSQEMCLDGRRVMENFIITVRSLAPGQTWEQAVQEAVQKLSGKLPAGDGGIPINQDVAIVRIDLDGDGRPEIIKQVNLKTGEISDLVIKYKSGGSINVSGLPLHERDLHIEGSNDGKTTVVDPTYSEQSQERRPGPRQSPDLGYKNTPNPPHEWMVKDGRLQRVIPIGPNGEMILTPESQNRLTYDYLRIFIQYILQSDVMVDIGGGDEGADSSPATPDVAPSAGEKGLTNWLQAPVEEWRKLSAEQLAQKYGMTVAQAQRILESIPQYEARCRAAGASVEPKPGQTTISYLEDIFEVIRPNRR